MIHIERAGAEDLETIIAIQRASFKAVYEKYHDQYDPYLEERERIRWKLVERPNSFYYFVKDGGEDVLGDGLELVAQVLQLLLGLLQRGALGGPDLAAEGGGVGAVPDVGVGQGLALGVQLADLVGEAPVDDRLHLRDRGLGLLG